jgi:hypothetical protein
MASGQEWPYKVDPTGPANQQIRQLVAKAEEQGTRTSVLATLAAIVRQLRTRPLEWGDPLYHTRLEGGLVCRGLEEPLIALYAVFESRKLVWLLDVRAISKSPLAE